LGFVSKFTHRQLRETRHGKRPDEDHQGKKETESRIGQTEAIIRLQTGAAGHFEKIGDAFAPALHTSTAWSRKDQPDGSALLSVKQALAIEWDSKVGAAWANLTVPDLVTVEVRLAPSDDQRKVGASVQRSLPIGRSLSVTLQNDLSMTENYPAAITGSAPGTSPKIWDSERRVKLDIATTGTTLAAASSSSSLDNLTHHTLSAEQKIYGPLQVKTSVADPGQPTSSKSITAGFKLNW
jgi:hypothetical protein